jgi:hypothetical protein
MKAVVCLLLLLSGCEKIVVCCLLFDDRCDGMCEKCCVKIQKDNRRLIFEFMNY